MKNNYRSIRFELLKVLIGTSIITMLIVGTILSIIMFRQSFQQAKKDMNFYVESIQNQFGNHLTFLEDAVIYIRNNKEIDAFLQGVSTDKEELEMIFEKGVNLFASGNMIAGSYPVVRDIYIFTKDMESISIHYYPISTLEHRETEQRFRLIMHNYMKDGFIYYRYGTSLELYFPLYDDAFQLKGYCVAVLEEQAFHEVFSQLEKYQNYAWGILNQGKFLLGQSFIDNRPDITGLESGWIYIKGRRYYLKREYYGFSLSTYILIPEDKLYMHILPSFGLAWLLAISSWIGLFFVIFFLSKYLSKPLQDIVDKLKKVGEGDFSARLADYEIEEFRDISVSFNEMADRMDHLIKEVYEAQLLAKEARIQYLQAQINPHFMFNVLSMISIRLKLQKDTKVYPLVSAFAGLMQGKLFRKNEIEIPLKEEMEIVSFYLYLSEERFKENLSYEIYWEDESLKECYIPRLCIEPIVENAMIHGLEPKKEKGKIRVYIATKEEKLYIAVEDNGVGFEPEEVEKHQSSPRVGIMNIQRLIYNLYGQEYGIQIDSKIDVGTKVEIYLPLKWERTV